MAEACLREADALQDLHGLEPLQADTDVQTFPCFEIFVAKDSCRELISAEVASIELVATLRPDAKSLCRVKPTHTRVEAPETSLRLPQIHLAHAHDGREDEDSQTVRAAQIPQSAPNARV